MDEWNWKFRVEGTFVQAGTGHPLFPCEAIIESGISGDELSPHALRGVGPIAHAGANGTFRSWYVTKGAEHPATCPSTVSVFIRVARGAWHPYVVPVNSSQCTTLSLAEILLALGDVPIDRVPYVEA